MKKCKKCGAVQNDERTTCVDCGTVLGRPMDEAEEAQAEAALDNRLDGLADRVQDFYVSIPQKVMGILSILAAVAAVVMLMLVSEEKPKLSGLIPEHVMITSVGGAIAGATAINMETGELYDVEIPQHYFNRMNELDDAASSALYALGFSILAVPMLLVPRLMWLLNTLGDRLWYDRALEPSYFALIVRKSATYLAFAAGLIGVIYSYFLYFG